MFGISAASAAGSVAVIALTALTACSRRQSEAELSKAAPAACAQQVASPAPSDREIVTAFVTFVSFRSDVLDECVQFGLEASPPTTEDEISKYLDASLSKKTGKEKQAPGVRTVRSGKTCDEAVSGRKVLATCTRNGPDSQHAAWKSSVEARYYNVATAIDTDVFMRQCLEIGGSWTVSPEADVEILRQRNKAHHRVLDGLSAE